MVNGWSLAMAAGSGQEVFKAHESIMGCLDISFRLVLGSRQLLSHTRHNWWFTVHPTTIKHD